LSGEQAPRRSFAAIKYILALEDYINADNEVPLINVLLFLQGFTDCHAVLGVLFEISYTQIYSPSTSPIASRFLVEETQPIAFFV